jgi:hypothetical protein
MVTSDSDTASSASDAERVRLIEAAISYSRLFRGNWFIVHATPSAVEAPSISHDLLLLRSLGIYVAVVVPEPAQAGADQEKLAVDLRKALNRDDLTAVVLHWEETRGEDFGRQPTRRWQSVAEASDLIPIVKCAPGTSFAAALTLAVECSASKLLLLEPDWDPALLPVGGPGTPMPSALEVRSYLPSLRQGGTAATVAVEAAEAGVSEIHILPTSGNLNPILLEIFTDAGIGTWIGP